MLAEAVSGSCEKMTNSYQGVDSTSASYETFIRLQGKATNMNWTVHYLNDLVPVTLPRRSDAE